MCFLWSAVPYLYIFGSS